MKYRRWLESNPADSHEDFKLERSEDRTFREAQEVLYEHKPQILFLCETKMTKQQMRKKSNELHFPNCFTVSRAGMGGGLGMLWSSEVTVEIKSYSLHQVDAVVHSENGSYWRCTGIFGHPESAQNSTYGSY